MKRKPLLQVMVAGLLLMQTPIWSLSPGTTCKEVISKHEVEKGIPQDLLKAIARVESGISPWAINAKGRAHIFKSKEAAAKYIRELVDSGFSNFSVGVMQLHYASHRRHFKSVEAMLDPENNVAHAARLIKKLERRHGSMERAIKLYHSPSPFYHNLYKNRVYGMWARIRGPLKPKKTTIKTVALQKVAPQKPSVKAAGKAPKINFGVAGVVSKKTKRQKI